MKIKSVCYNLIHFLRSIFFSFKNVIYFNFQIKFNKNFFGAKFHSLCKICLNEESNTLLLPCHHVSTCHFCTICIEFCPICRCKIESIIKVYFAWTIVSKNILHYLIVNKCWGKDLKVTSYLITKKVIFSSSEIFHSWASFFASVTDLFSTLLKIFEMCFLL